MAKNPGARGAVKPSAGEQHDLIFGAIVIIGIVVAVNFLVRSRAGAGATLAVSSAGVGAGLQAGLDQMSAVPSDMVNAPRTPGIMTEQQSATSDDGRYPVIDVGFAIGNNVPLSSN